MSAETRQSLDDAEREYDEAKKAEHRAGRELLGELAAALPARVERLTRDMVGTGPETARALGKEGVKELRASLRAAAEELAEQVRTKPGTPWRGTYALNFGVNEYAVTSSLVALFGPPERRKLVSTLRDAGFNPREPFPSERLAETVAHLDKINALVRAAEVADEAGSLAAAARKANDYDDVADLWGD
ncbi:hypothetical protein [Curtobacterium flaccumfaciens]|uniref:hypothetical protein n=1 Tax=Curtobacterium flaccumfaciens TaxID=2035 RepID=UPI00105E3DF9|nr:hypothetical protein [Curtobacterium flaccumfaciens]